MPGNDHCCVPEFFADRRKEKGVSFHSFPPGNNKVLRKKWIHALHCDPGKVFQITSNTTVCSLHFLKTDKLILNLTQQESC